MSPTTTMVDRLHTEFSDLISLLDKAGEISLRSTADDNFRKSLLLSAASYFERKIIEGVISFISESSQGNNFITSFVRNKAVSRQFHSWFDWEEKNANRFFGFFGKNFLTYMKRIVKEDEALDKSVRAFLELGRDRNRLVHQDFVSFSMEKTSDEIYQLYQFALKFVEKVPAALREFSNNQEKEAASAELMDIQRITESS
jgi:hypothetical protein